MRVVRSAAKGSPARASKEGSLCVTGHDNIPRIITEDTSSNREGTTDSNIKVALETSYRGETTVMVIGKANSSSIVHLNVS
jgi:hypothetical protein